MAADPPAATPETDVAGGFAVRRDEVLERIAAAARRVGRSPADVTLVAVSKGFGAQVVAAALVAGQTDFGESRAQALRDKARAVEGPIRWHFVGRLQRNKVKYVVGTAALIHSVDNLELAEVIGRRARRDGRVQPVLLQVNAGDDPAKGGCAPEEALALAERVRRVEGIVCQGLMTIPPLDVDPRPSFATLRELVHVARERFPEIRHLSMGMSRDYEVAVEEGATIVRVGEALFGPRRRRD